MSLCLPAILVQLVYVHSEAGDEAAETLIAGDFAALSEAGDDPVTLSGFHARKGYPRG